MLYRCGNDDGDPFTQNNENDKQKNYVWFGIPKADMFTSEGKVMCDKVSKKWKYLICDYERGRYGWRQPLGHVAAEHCYASRLINGRWGIPEEGT